MVHDLAAKMGISDISAAFGVQNRGEKGKTHEIKRRSAGRRVVARGSFAALLAIAQVQRGSITGTVFDSHGAVVPDAQVTATDNSTGAVLTVKTSNEGTFRIPRRT